MNIINEIKKIKVGKILENIELKKFTTYQLNETALALVYPDSIDNLVKLLKYLKDKEVKYKIIGNGSNLIFRKHYDGILINLTDLNNISVNENVIKVESGYSLVKLALKAADLGLSGLEFAAGIPGTVGGA